ncbi:esterase [Taibaiella sp. KBW10]|uniref:hotdog fold thioesterase n=1 Tax=Taibaiella sp. KBW10 TaxID=2153357 RepID=UPI000F5996F8|nr:hotdog fold thioesterase [Taibaiella sp. KBW10]RQO31086.1 esterase [Taibaiella sp. KBW10]
MIWYNGIPSLAQLNEMTTGTLSAHLNMKFTDVGEDYLSASMPVNPTTHQPMGLLHGGASAALAETVGSVAGWLCINKEKQDCVGIELNCNHIKGKREGLVTATARPLHIGASTQVWDIKLTDENNKLICVGRLTVAVIKKVQL